MLTVALVAAWQQYQYEQLGFVMLKTSGPPLKAEILNEYNELVVPSFTVPTEQPVEVLKGSYWLRLSAPRQLSETFQIQVEPGHRQQATVQLTPRLFKVKEEALPPGPPLFDLGPLESEVNEGTEFLIDPSIADAPKPPADSPAGRFAALLPKLGFRPVAHSPRLPRCLPWAGEYLRWYSWVNGYFFFYGGTAELTAAGLACLTLAAWLGCLAWSQKSRRWAWTALALAALGYALKRCC